MREKNGFSKYFNLTVVIGFGFFTMGLMETLYDSYVPLHLSRYFEGRNTDQIKGFIMTIDNILAIFLIPLITTLSDRTRTRMGRRMPWILALLPVCALLFALLPAAALPATSALLILAVVVFNIFLKPARGVVVALMPDTVPGEFRSQANGIINTLGGIGAIVGTLLLAPLVIGLEEQIPALDGRPRGLLAFPVSALFVLGATMLLGIFVREKPIGKQQEQAKEKKGLREAWFFLKNNPNISQILIILSAIFFWFLSYEGLKAFLSLYSKEFLSLPDSQAALTAGIVGVAYAIFAIGSGFVAQKLGRKRTILISLFMLITILVTGYFFTLSLSGQDVTRAAAFSFWGMMFLFGLFWAAVSVNSFPMLWQMSSFHNIGMFTGFYYIARQTAAIIGPTLVGFINKGTGSFTGMFLFAAFGMGVAFLLILFLKKGEATDKSVEEEEAVV